MSKREAALVIALLLGVIGFLVYNFVYVPKTEEMVRLEEELTRTSEERQSIEKQISKIDELQQQIDDAEMESYHVAPNLFQHIAQEDLIVLLYETAKEASFGVESRSFSAPTISNIPIIDKSQQELDFYLKQLVDDYKLKRGLSLPDKGGQEPDEGAAGADLSIQLEKTSVTLSFTGTYTELMKYMELVEELKEEIIVSSIDIDGADGDILTGSMTLDFYQLQKLFPLESDSRFSEWENPVSIGMENPFGGEGAQTLDSINGAQRQSNNTEITAQSISYAKPDFFLIARAYSSGLPTMTVGYDPDKTGSTYIRDTISGEENVTVELTAQNGRYYYRFVSATGTYPIAGSREFTPLNNDIRFTVYSSRRVGGDDNNRINLTIVNNTGLVLNWTVDGDDRSRPRVNVTVR